MYAIIKTGGKQYRVQEGETIFVEKLEAEVDSAVVFDEVLAVGGEGDLKVGTPVVSLLQRLSLKRLKDNDTH